MSGLATFRVRVTSKTTSFGRMPRRGDGRAKCRRRSGSTQPVLCARTLETTAYRVETRRAQSDRRFGNLAPRTKFGDGGFSPGAADLDWEVDVAGKAFDDAPFAFLGRQR